MFYSIYSSPLSTLHSECNKKYKVLLYLLIIVVTNIIYCALYPVLLKLYPYGSFVLLLLEVTQEMSLCPQLFITSLYAPARLHLPRQTLASRTQPIQSQKLVLFQNLPCKRNLLCSFQFSVFLFSFDKCLSFLLVFHTSRGTQASLLNEEAALVKQTNELLFKSVGIVWNQWVTFFLLFFLRTKKIIIKLYSKIS